MQTNTRRPTNGRAIVCLTISVLAISCSGSSDQGTSDDPVPTTSNDFVEFEEAERALGFTLVFPEYVTPGLAIPDEVGILRGRIPATLHYGLDGRTPKEDVILQLAAITQDQAAKHEELAPGEEFEVAGVEVHYAEYQYGATQNVLVAEWLDEPRFIDATFLGGDGVPAAAVRAEAIKVIESLITPDNERGDES